MSVRFVEGAKRLKLRVHLDMHVVAPSVSLQNSSETLREWPKRCTSVLMSAGAGGKPENRAGSLQDALESAQRVRKAWKGGRKPCGAPENCFERLRYFFAADCFSRNSLIICSCVARGTGWYLANSMENSPLPCVAERRSVE